MHMEVHGGTSSVPGGHMYCAEDGQHGCGISTAQEALETKGAAGTGIFGQINGRA